MIEEHEKPMNEKESLIEEHRNEKESLIEAHRNQILKMEDDAKVENERVENRHFIEK